ncbi:MAG: hypothetical protein QXK94_02530 [Candidatus Jordarchaeales archaeon]
MGGNKEGDSKVHRKKDLVIKLCRTLSVLVPARIKKKIEKELEDEFRLVLEEYKISGGELYGGCLIIGLIVSVGTFMCTVAFKKDYLLATTISVSMFLISFNLPIFLFLGEMKGLKTRYIQYADIILETFLFSEAATGNIHNAFEILAELEDQVIASFFKKKLKDILFGSESADESFLDIIEKTPLKVLRKQGYMLLKPAKLHADWRLAIMEARSKIKENYQRYNLEIESRVTIVAGIVMFLPLLLLVWLIAPYTEPLLYSMLPLQVGITAALSKFLLKLKEDVF